MLNLRVQGFCGVPEPMFVDVGRSVDLRMLEADQKCKLDHIEERNESQNVLSEVIDDTEESKHDPVGQPLFLELMRPLLQCMEAHKRGVGHPDCAGDVLLAKPERHEHDSHHHAILGQTRVVTAHRLQDLHLFIYLSCIHMIFHSLTVASSLHVAT